MSKEFIFDNSKDGGDVRNISNIYIDIIWGTLVLSPPPQSLFYSGNSYDQKGMPYTTVGTLVSRDVGPGEPR